MSPRNPRILAAETTAMEPGVDFRAGCARKLVELPYPLALDSRQRERLRQSGLGFFYQTNVDENNEPVLSEADPLTPAFLRVLRPPEQYCPQVNVKSWIYVLKHLRAEPGLDHLCRALAHGAFLTSLRRSTSKDNRPNIGQLQESVPPWTRCVAALTVQVVWDVEKGSVPNADFLKAYNFEDDRSLRKAAERALGDFYAEACAEGGPRPQAFYWLARALAHLDPGKAGHPWQLSVDAPPLSGNAKAVPLYFDRLARGAVEEDDPKTPVFNYLGNLLAFQPPEEPEFLPGLLHLSFVQRLLAKLTGNPSRMSWCAVVAMVGLLVAMGCFAWGVRALSLGTQDLEPFRAPEHELEQQLKGVKPERQ